MKFLRVVGARPQFMQAAILRQEIDKRGYSEILVHTGQHYDQNMSQIFFDELGIPKPDINLGVGSGSQGVQTGRMLSFLDEIILENRPDAVIVDGDTNSTLAGALAGAKLHVPLVHVEAGLRSFDRHMPEEINRIVADHVSDLLCAPTEHAVTNLTNENLLGRTVLTGDLMYDCFQFYKDKAKTEIIDKLDIHPGEYMLATVHRAENTDDPEKLHRILCGLTDIDCKIIFPVHPRVRPKILGSINQGLDVSNIQFIDPIGYLEMLALEISSKCILTDSGGVQREAYFAQRPSVVLRETTEWVEQVEAGWTVLAGSDSTAITQGVALVNNTPANITGIYGDGYAARKIVNAIENSLK